MNQVQIQRMNYDSENDVLYLAFSAQHNSYGDEISDHIILRRDWDSDEITGVTILDFMLLLRNCSDEIRQIPFCIDFQSQVLPFLYL